MQPETTGEDTYRQRLESLGHSFPNLGRLCAAGELSAAISHELQQPLCAISIYADTCLRLIKSARRDETAIEQALHDIQTQVTRAANIIRRLRRFVRSQPPTLEEVRLREAVSNVLVLVEIEAHANDVSLEVDIPSTIPVILADAVQIEQVLLNLLRNGLEAVGEDDEPRRVRLIAREAEPGGLEIEVRNTGPSIPDAVRHRLFQPFFSTKKEGLGIGLYIARMIIEAHGGSIECTSEEGETCFRVRLPTRPTAATGFTAT